MKVIKNCQGSMTECLPLEFGKDTVYVRENIKRISIENMELWQYDETQYGLEEYDRLRVADLYNMPSNQLNPILIKSQILESPPESIIVTDGGEVWDVELKRRIVQNEDKTYNYELLKMNREKFFTQEEMVMYFRIYMDEMFEIGKAPEYPVQKGLASNLEMLRIIDNLCDEIKVLNNRIVTLEELNC